MSKSCYFKNKTFSSFIPVLIVMALIGYSYYGFVVAYLIPMILKSQHKQISFPKEKDFYFPFPMTIIVLIVYHILLLIWLICYVRCIFTDPGTVPEAFKFDENDEAIAESELRRSLGIESVVDTRGVCTKCQIRKPPRAHHCSTCGRCVLKMDHHCPWVGNCVGSHNYKFFVLFLFWTSILGFFVGTFTIPRLTSMSMRNGGINPLIVLIMAVVFGFGLFAFFVTHFRLMMENQTTIESMTNSTNNNIYNVGIKANIKQVLGENYFLWFLPIRNKNGLDGLTFPERVNDETRLLGDDEDAIH